jgi:hypothetical protein
MLEDQMGDLPSNGTAAGTAHNDQYSHATPSSSILKSPTSNTPFYSQLSSIPQTPVRPDLRSPAHLANPHYTEHGATAMNMGAMAGALPDYGSLDGSQSQRHLSGASTSALVYQFQQNLQMSNSVPGGLPAQPPYGSGYSAGQFQQNFAPSQGSQHANYAIFPSGQQRLQAPGPTPQNPYHHFGQPAQYMFYPSPYGPQAQYSPGFSGQSFQGQPMYGRKPSMTHGHLPGQNMEMSQQDGGFTGGRIVSGGNPRDAGTVGAMFGNSFMNPQGEYTT